MLDPVCFPNPGDNKGWADSKLVDDEMVTMTTLCDDLISASRNGSTSLRLGPLVIETTGVAFAWAVKLTSIPSS